MHITPKGLHLLTASALALSVAAPVAASADTAAAAKPGAGKPTVTFGDKNFTEQNILGALYANALRAKGFKIKLKDNIGSSEITWKALTSGQIDAYPEYTGTLLSAIAKQTNPPKSAKAAYSQSKSFAAKKGFRLLNATPFADSDVLAVKSSYAKKNNLKSIGDLKKLNGKFTLGAPPEFATRSQALPGLKSAYGINPTFKPIAIGLSYTALNSGQVDVQDVFTTDGQLAKGGYTLLKDPKGVFGFQNVAPVVNAKVLKRQGPAFTNTINAVSKLLTLKAVQALNAAVSVKHQPVGTVSKKFLKANHLL